MSLSNTKLQLFLLFQAIAAGGTGAAAPGGKKVVSGAVDQDGAGIELALNPDELDLDSAAIQAKYDQQMREQQSHLAKEDLSDMVAEHAAKQKVVLLSLKHGITLCLGLLWRYHCCL